MESNTRLAVYFGRLSDGFGNMLASGNPCVSNPSPGQWFNASVFQPIPANTYVLRTIPVQYSCLTGPSFMDVDASLVTSFHMGERCRAELKMTADNALHNLNRGDPSTNVYDSNFGKALYQGSPGGTFGSQGGTSAYISWPAGRAGFQDRLVTRRPPLRRAVHSGSTAQPYTE